MIINKLISAIWSAHYDEELTWDEAMDGIKAIWLSPHLGDTVDEDRQKYIDDFFEMNEYTFGSGLKRETY